MLTNRIKRSSILPLFLVLPSFENPYSAVAQQQDEQFTDISPARVPRRPFSHAFEKELIRMQATPFSTMKEREELKAQRNLLFELFSRNPLDTGLALKIKIIDDQVAAFTEQMERERKAELSSMRLLSNPVSQRHHGPNSKKLESRR
jgi:hypothetical protein